MDSQSSLIASLDSRSSLLATPSVSSNGSSPAAAVAVALQQSTTDVPRFSNGLEVEDPPGTSPCASTDYDADDIYEVERVVAAFMDWGKDQLVYEIKWKNWPSSTNTLEAEDRLDCPEKLAAFYAHLEEKRKKYATVAKQDMEPKKAMGRSSVRNDPIGVTLEPMKEGSPKAFTDIIYRDVMPYLRNGNRTLSTIRADHPGTGPAYFLRIGRNRTHEELLEHAKIGLKAWEERINERIRGLEARVTVQNDVDLDRPPGDFKYIVGYICADDVELNNEPPFGCSCENEHGACSAETNCCPVMGGMYFPYDRRGRLKLAPGNSIYECNKRCRCSVECRNRVVQRGRTIKIITNHEAELRGRLYDQAGATYLMDMCFQEANDSVLTVDAGRFGNVMHFVNHSCEPNMRLHNVYIDNLDPSQPRLAFFAAREIGCGEELTFDYKNLGLLESRSLELIEELKSYDNISRDDPEFKRRYMMCRCGAKTCREWVFF